MKIAIIGAHPQETKALYENMMQKFSIIELAACADPDEQIARNMAEIYGIEALQIEEILQNPEIKVILNATFAKDTEDITERCLRAGKHVYTVKQIANTWERGRELYDLAVEYGVELSCGPDCIFGAGIQTARYMLDHGAIGRVHSAAAVLARDNHFIAEVLPHVMQPGGGILYDMSGYFLMSMFFMFGSVKKVTAFGNKGEATHTVKKLDSEHRGLVINATEYEVLSIILEFEHNIMVTLHLNSNSIFHKSLFEIAGDNGVISVGYPHEFDAPVSLTTFGMQKMDVPFRFGFQDPVYGVGVADLAWAVENNRPARVDKKIALHDLEVMKGIEKSLETGEVYEMTTSIKRPEPLEEGYYGNGFWVPGEETALAI